MSDDILGKQWHVKKSAFRPTAGQTSYEKRAAERKTNAAMKAKEKEMKDEKEDERQVRCKLSSMCCEDGSWLTVLSQRRIQAIKDKRVAKEERERYEQMAQKMHRRRVERVKRREKRNKMLNS